MRRPGWAGAIALTRWLPVIAVFLVTLPPLGGLFRTQGAPMEEGFMLVFPELVMRGQVPNRDFLHLYGPGSLWVLAAVFSVTGVSLGVERTVGYLQHLGLAFGVVRLLRPWGPWVSAGGGAISALLILTPSGLSAMAWVGGLALALWSLVHLLDAADHPQPHGRPRHALLAGLFAGAALLYRLDLVVALVAVGLVMARSLDRAAWRKAALGLAIGLAPYLVHFALAGPVATIKGLVIEPVFDLRGGRRLPLPHRPTGYDGYLQGAGELDPPPWPLASPSGHRQLWLWLFALLAVGIVLVVAGLVARRRTGSPRLLAIAALSVGIFPQALQRPDSTHLAWVSCVAFAVLPAALIELWRAVRSPRLTGPSPLGGGTAAVVAPALLLLVVAPFYTYRSYADMTATTIGQRNADPVIEHEGRSFPYERQDAVAALREMLPVVEEVTEPGDRLVVGPGDLRKTPYSEAFLYYLLPDLVPGTRYIEMDPGVANAPDSGLAEEIAAADVVILSTIRDDWNEPNESVLFGPDKPNQVLEERFCLRGRYGTSEFDPDRGLYELYTRCRGPGAAATAE